MIKIDQTIEFNEKNELPFGEVGDGESVQKVFNSTFETVDPSGSVFDVAVAVTRKLLEDGNVDILANMFVMMLSNDIIENGEEVGTAN